MGVARSVCSPLVFPPASLAYSTKAWKRTILWKEEAVGVDLPQCQKCHQGLLVPLSDFGPRGAALPHKVWACINPKCGFTIRIDKGVIIHGLKVGETKRGDR
jgi:hypothetical protein